MAFGFSEPIVAGVDRLPSLNPYGHSGPANVDHQWSHEYLAAAFDRARHKVASVVTEAPVGPDTAYRTYGWLNLGAGLLWLAGMAAVMGSTKGGVVGGIVWPIILIAGSLYWFTWYKNSNPNQPERVVRAWIGAIMRKKWERVDRLRLPGDRDGFPRRLPDGEGAVELPMATVHDVEQYWKEYRRRAGLQRGRWTLKKPAVRMLNQWTALVELELSAPRLPQWTAFIGLGVFFAVLAAMVVLVIHTKKTPEWFAALPLVLLVLLVVMLVVIGWRRKHHIKKVVVWNGSEWRLLSGEWQAPEDRDLRWMQ
jgi:hypothetical protein